MYILIGKLINKQGNCIVNYKSFYCNGATYLKLLVGQEINITKINKVYLKTKQNTFVGIKRSHKNFNRFQLKERINWNNYIDNKAYLKIKLNKLNFFNNVIPWEIEVLGHIKNAGILDKTYTYFFVFLNETYNKDKQKDNYYLIDKVGNLIEIWRVSNMVEGLTNVIALYKTKGIWNITDFKNDNVYLIEKV